jgi:hypothetical protein
VVTGAAGFAFAIAGSVAAFVTNNQAGTVAIIILGAILILVSILGQQIARFRAGSYEVVFALLAQANENLARGDDDRADALVETALSQVAQESAGFTPSREPSDFVEAAVLLREVSRVLDGIPNTQFRTEVRSGRVRFDGLLEQNGISVAVDVKISRFGNVDHIIGSVVSMATRATPPPDGMLVVLYGPTTVGNLLRLTEVTNKVLAIPLRAVHWQLEDPHTKLREAATDLLQQLASDG